jgi:hypothetical protein
MTPQRADFNPADKYEFLLACAREGEGRESWTAALPVMFGSYAPTSSDELARVFRTSTFARMGSVCRRPTIPATDCRTLRILS